MQLKVVVKALGREVPIDNLINLEHLNPKRMVDSASNIIYNEARKSVLSPNASHQEMKQNFSTLVGEITRTGRVPNLPTQTIDKYPNDDMYAEQMSMMISSNSNKVEIPDDAEVPIYRKFKMNDKGEIFLLPNPHTNNYVFLHLMGYRKMDMDNRTKNRLTKGVYYLTGPITNVKGRDVMLTAVLNSIPEIVKMMKDNIFRKLGNH